MKTLFTNEIKRNLLIDVIIFVLFLTVYEVKATGETIHEWLGIVIGAIIIIHIILHWKWLVQKTKQFIEIRTSIKIRYIIDILIFIGFTTVSFTGIMMSKSVLPSFGIELPKSHFWREIHSLSVDLTLFLTAIHFALNWKWIVKNFGQCIIQPIKNRMGSKIAVQTVIEKQVETKPSPSATIVNLGIRFLLILIFSGFISLGWYAISQTVADETKRDGSHQNVEQKPENGTIVNSDKSPEEFNQHHKNHKEPSGIFVLEILKNILIFAFVTFVVTMIGNKIERKRKLSISQ